eukprot:CAMPEP_0197438926 /NCGR_PEP_ID=MMETSP1175-20131217/5794_1 /TAXON_ID=1003142 /ORGANISM="Triceratium dubium, Strain CCMP147" /LENGTH=212 /DNA_ID=CAMNT_0042968747 /DNA_START=119 /DNA_END=757 /DNA_ORIENTATION=-
MTNSLLVLSSLLVASRTFSPSVVAFAPLQGTAFVLGGRPNIPHERRRRRRQRADTTHLNYIDEEKPNANDIDNDVFSAVAAAVAPVVDGARLEKMMDEWDDGPLVVDAFATWCGPCARMSEEYDAVARELEGRVRLVKLDIDRDPKMAGRLGISSVPTLLFLDRFGGDAEGDGKGKRPKAVLKERLEGSINKDTVKALCDHHFFDGPQIDRC